MQRVQLLGELGVGLGIPRISEAAKPWAWAGAAVGPASKRNASHLPEGQPFTEP